MQGETIKLATLRTILDQAGLSVDQFIELLEGMRRYTIILEHDPVEVGYTVIIPILPGCVSQGEAIVGHWRFRLGSPRV